MENDEILEAQEEIKKTLFLCNFCLTKVGLSIIDEPPATFWGKFKNMLRFGVSAIVLLLMVAVEIAYVSSLLASSTSVAEFVASLHIVGYGFISVGKMAVLWYKRNDFKQLIRELPDIWPVRPRDEEALDIKKRSLAALRLFHYWYIIINKGSLMLYYLTPIGLHLYRKVRGEDTNLGYVWHATYPFDKHKTYYHEAVFLFEISAGQSAVWFMLSSDLLFTAMTSHISMLLRLLQLKIRYLGKDTTVKEGTQHCLAADTSVEGHKKPPLVMGISVEGLERNNVDCLDDIIACVKIHQRLIKYFNDLEDAFSPVNFINALLSSIDICCVVFVIVLLEPWMEVSNKFFLCAAATQMGVLCWYADDICTASVEVADSVYESGWYKSNTRSRRFFLSIMQRSQKPLYYTAMKFNNITMSTFVSILTTAYSYFALLYTMYSQN